MSDDIDTDTEIVLLD